MVKVIWIADKIGYLEGYSEVEQPDLIEVEITLQSDTFLFDDWRWDGETLIFDPENKPIVEEPKTDIEQLQAGLAQASFQLMQSNKQIEELIKQNAAMGFKIMQLEQNQNTESGVN